MDLDTFIKRHSELLELEREEAEQNAQAQERFTLRELENKGLVIKRVLVDSCCPGLYGRRHVYNFRPCKRRAPFPANKFASGDVASIVLAGDPAREGICSGVVTRVTQAVISVAVDNAADSSLYYDDRRLFHLFKLANDVTHRRLKSTLEMMQKRREIRFSPLIQLLFGTTKLTSASETRDPGNALGYFNKNLDASQKEAVKFALSQKEVGIIHGPPGTGKTTTLIEVVMQLVRNGSKVLVCAPSNIAVDNLVEKLISYEGRVKVVRLGHPARVLPEIQRYCLDAVVERSKIYSIMENMRKELDSLLSAAKKGCVTNRCRAAHRRRDKQRELQLLEQHAVEMTLRDTDVVLSTLTTASEEGPLNRLPPEFFDVAVVDECSQALEVACWMALLRAPKCVLAGDHLQLPPTIVSKRAADGGLSLTLMERLLKLHGNSIVKMLTVQYRMNADIMRWSSDKLYEGKLEAHNSVERHLLRDVPGVVDNKATSTPLLLIDTAGCGMYELDTVHKDSKSNEGEADLVCIHVENLISSGVKAADIAVISPYNLQVELLQLRLRSKHDDLEIQSVDGFQGREKEAVVMSFVRSNTKGTVGFLAEERRINVAVTRARRHLAVVCDSATVSRHPFIKSLVDYLTTNGSVQCAQEYSADLARRRSLRPSNVKLNQKKVSTKSQKSKKHETTMGAAHKPKDGGRDDGKKERVVEEVEKFRASTRSVHTFPNLDGCESLRPSDVKLNQKKVSTKSQKSSHLKKHQKGETTMGAAHKGGRPFQLELKCKDGGQDDGKKERVVEEVEKFFASTETSYTFPSTLSSYERNLVHEVAEKFGLWHIKLGGLANRRIMLRKL
ncbi:DNA-binding protein SMUBP-2-like isoform X3 [Ornithodoros turicata]|uniref:DNA-binding protein SMUBP-2-like isoform X3 n=1 Tax=Ornithodoros turicata TaxID=34597 RepID=UPI003138DA66